MLALLMLKESSKEGDTWHVKESSNQGDTWGVPRKAIETHTRSLHHL